MFVTWSVLSVYIHVYVLLAFYTCFLKKTINSVHVLAQSFVFLFWSTPLFFFVINVFSPFIYAVVRKTISGVHVLPQFFVLVIWSVLSACFYVNVFSPFDICNCKENNLNCRYIVCSLLCI